MTSTVTDQEEYIALLTRFGFKPSTEGLGKLLFYSNLPRMTYLVGQCAGITSVHISDGTGLYAEFRFRDGKFDGLGCYQ